jgi:hypothetical protein
MKFLLPRDFVTIFGMGIHPLQRTHLFMLLLISEGCDHSFFFFLQKEPFDWPITNIVETPQHRSLNMLPSPK